jgi:hypothetical protein
VRRAAARHLNEYAGARRVRTTVMSGAIAFREEPLHQCWIGPFGKLRLIVVDINPGRLRSNDSVVRDPDPWILQ